MSTDTETQTTTLGRSGLEVSPIAFGTWQLGGDWGRFDERDAIVIATKGGLRIDDELGQVRDSSPKWLRRGVEGSLQALGIERIDLYQIHWPDPHTPFAETAGGLRELVEEGKIAHVGVSNFDAAQMEEFSRTLPVETLQPPYHLFRRDVEDEVLPYCAANDIGVLVYGPLAHGLLTGAIDEDTDFGDDDWRSDAELFQGETLRGNLEVVRRLAEVAERRGCRLSQLAVAWTLAHPAVDVAIVGTRSHEHIEEALAAAAIELSDDELAEIDRIMADATPAPGPGPEGV